MESTRRQCHSREVTMHIVHASQHRDTPTMIIRICSYITFCVMNLYVGISYRLDIQVWSLSYSSRIARSNTLLIIILYHHISNINNRLLV